MPRSVAGQRQVVRDFGTCLLFNGSAGKMAASQWSTAIINVSMSCWFKSSNYKRSRQPIIGNGTFNNNGYGLSLSGNGTTDGSIWILNQNVGWIDCGFKVQDNKWHHIMLTIDGSNLTIVYLDGVSRYSATNVLGVPAGGSVLAGDNTAVFLGLLDDARFYTRNLSSTEVSDLYYGIEPSPGPANWYKLDEGSGTTATDSGSSPKNGTITTGTYSTNVFMKPRTASGTRTLVDTRSFMT